LCSHLLCSHQSTRDGRPIRSRRSPAKSGYGDSVSFRRLFKRLVASTPAIYRRRQRMLDAVRNL
jgi:methylphosphotriester-DNA--protein-cysteine methyltransferase